MGVTLTAGSATELAQRFHEARRSNAKGLIHENATIHLPWDQFPDDAKQVLISTFETLIETQ